MTLSTTILSARWMRTPGRIPVISSFWRLFTSVRFAVILIAMLTSGIFIGVIVSQVPQEIAISPPDFANWVETQARPRYGIFTDLLLMLGFFDVFHTVWFRALLGLLFVAIVICTLNRFPAIYQTTIKAKRTVSESFLRSSKNRAAFTLHTGVEDLVRVLKSKRYGVTVIPQGENVHIYADKNAWAKYATFVSHLGLLVFLAGGLATNALGYQRFLVIADGASQPIYPVYHEDQMQVFSDGFTVEYYPDGRPKDYYSDLIIYKGGAEASRGRIRVNSPLDYDGFRFHQNSFGPTVRLNIENASGQTLFSETMILGQVFGAVPFDIIQIPTTDYTAIVALVEGNTTSNVVGGTFIRGGQEQRVAVLGFKGGDTSQGQPDFSARLAAGETSETAGLKISFEGTHFFTGVVARKDPGAALIWIASTLLIPAVWATFWFARRRIWVQVVGQQVMMAGMADHFVNLQAEIDEIVQAVGHPPAPEPTPERQRPSLSPEAAD